MRAAFVAPMLALACAGWAASDLGFGVAMRLDFDPSITDGELAAVASLLVSSSGDEHFSYPIDPGRPFQRVEQLVYRPNPTTRTLLLSAEALDAQGQVVGAGATQPLTLEADHTENVSLILTAGAQADMSLSDGPVPSVDAGDAAPFDAMTVDSAMRAPSNCSQLLGQPGILRCRSYEAASDITGAGMSSDGTVALDTAIAYRGSSSLHLGVAGTATTETARVSDSLGTSLPAYYGIRAFVYLPGNIPPNDALMSFQQSGSPYDSIALGVRADGTLYSQRIVAGGTQYRISTTKMPIGKWTCLELDVVRSTSATGSVNVYLGDQVVSDLALTGITQETPDLLLAIWGLYFGSTAMPVDVWYDEVVVAAQHVGCAE